MRRYLIVGVLLFIGFAVANAPAGIISRALGATGTVNLGQTEGTLWSGTGELQAQGHNLGQLAWRFKALSLLRLMPTFEINLSDPHSQLKGEAGYGLGGRVAAELEGTLDSRAINPWLSPYELQMTGAIDVDHLRLKLSDIANLGAPNTEVGTQFTQAEGLLHWSGGPVSYTLSGTPSTQRLPPMVGKLSIDEDGPRVDVLADPGDIPLMEMDLQNEGFVRIGITKRFTHILQSPWPGDEPDDAIVLQVEQQLF